ncbi:MAG: hypothetical protein QRY72_04520 [Candidatus Rhabdochlamydia sp.]
MNLLPFVTVFLLLLSVGTTFMLESVIQGIKLHSTFSDQQAAYHQLSSHQNQVMFEQYEKSHPQQESVKKKSEEKQAFLTQKPLKKPSKPSSLPYRSSKKGCEASKLNLWQMIHPPSLELGQTVEAVFIHLCDELYGKYPFYAAGGYISPAQTIASLMKQQNIHHFEELKIQDPLLDHIYYKMIQGTNSSYPSLKEYCLLQTGKREPIYFRFASKELLTALLGPSLSHHLFVMEEELHQTNPALKVLKKEQFLKEITPHLPDWIPASLIFKLLNFQNKQQGLPQSAALSAKKIRAFHRAHAQGPISL